MARALEAALHVAWRWRMARLDGAIATACDKSLHPVATQRWRGRGAWAAPARVRRENIRRPHVKRTACGRRYCGMDGHAASGRRARRHLPRPWKGRIDRVCVPASASVVGATPYLDDVPALPRSANVPHVGRQTAGSGGAAEQVVARATTSEAASWGPRCLPWPCVEGRSAGGPSDRKLGHARSAQARHRG